MAEPRKGIAWSWIFKMVDEYDFATPESGKSPTVDVSKDGGAFAGAANGPSEIGDGWYAVALTSEETTADVLILKATGSGCAQTDEAFYLPAHTAGSAVDATAEAVLREAINDHKGQADSLAAAVNLIRRAVAGKRDQTIATGTIRVYDTDDTSVLTTLTPSESEGVLTLDDA
ncbi:MAG: hypothetical protein JXQ73_17650 [Phycisphaerae bacterium]|nr:hypothetical protein [Phycisphaerae bacterium]